MAYPYTYNFNYYSGDAYHFVLYPKNDDGTSFDLINFSSQFTISGIRGNIASQKLVLYPEVETNPGRIYCFIDSVNGALLTDPVYYYDVEIKNGDEVYTLLTGQITTQNQVTISYQDVSIQEQDVIIDGGIPTSIYYQIFDGGTP